eukprot:TRINITY_DN6817_c0_g1_i1.p2 TRINITY_DN6817_c0_g1~~TRINITY_DN6817_c0_g1_i1.p2  ORF type:complete len:52 (+),score=8.79 TRINITY_DN6817_c0_g1_i1:255-410(+)
MMTSYRNILIWTSLKIYKHCDFAPDKFCDTQKIIFIFCGQENGLGFEIFCK